MIVGIGIDILELKRIEKIVQKKPQFIKRILTNKEIEFYKDLSEKAKIEFLGGRFCAKEAYSKAYGTGIGIISFKDIEIIKNAMGQPQIIHHPKETANAWVSISHSKEYVVAQVILESKDL